MKGELTVWIDMSKSGIGKNLMDVIVFTKLATLVGSSYWDQTLQKVSCFPMFYQTALSVVYY